VTLCEMVVWHWAVGKLCNLTTNFLNSKTKLISVWQLFHRNCILREEALFSVQLKKDVPANGKFLLFDWFDAHCGKQVLDDYV